MKCLAVGFAATLALLAASPIHAAPQQPLLSQTEDIYLSTLRKLISEWNQGTPLSKGGLDEAFGRTIEPVLRNRLERPYFGFENNAWYEERISEWKGLPNTLRPAKKSSGEAALLLEILYRGNLSSFSREVPPNEPAIRTLFVFLGSRF